MKNYLSDKMVDCMKRETFDITKVRWLWSRVMLPVIYSTHNLPHVNNRKSNHYDDRECPHGPGNDKNPILYHISCVYDPNLTFQEPKAEIFLKIFVENGRNLF